MLLNKFLLKKFLKNLKIPSHLLPTQQRVCSAALRSCAGRVTMSPETLGSLVTFPMVANLPKATGTLCTGELLLPSNAP